MADNFPDALARATQAIAIKGLQRAGEFENFVFSPYAVVKMMLSIFPFVSNEEKSRIAGFLEIKEKISTATPFLRLIQDINSKGSVNIQTPSKIWISKSLEKNETIEKMSAAGVGRGFETFNLNQPFYAIADEVELWRKERFGEAYRAYGSLLGAKDIQNPLGLLAVNETYASGSWLNQFHAHLINKSNFKTDGGQGILTPFMQRGGIFYSYIGPDCKMLEMQLTSKFPDERLSLILWAPRYESLKNFTGKMSGEYFREVSTRYTKELEQAFNMPLFSIKSKVTLSDLFGDQIGVDTLTGKNSIHGRLIHQASLVVSDSGMCGEKSLALKNTYTNPVTLPFSIFFFDAPFTFWLKDYSTGTIILTGQYTMPSRISK